MKVNLFKAKQKIQTVKQKIIKPVIKSGFEAWASSRTGLMPKDISMTIEAVGIATKDCVTRHTKIAGKILNIIDNFYLSGFIGKVSSMTGLPSDYLVNGMKTMQNFSKTFGVFVKNGCRKAV